MSFEDEVREVIENEREGYDNDNAGIGPFLHRVMDRLEPANPVAQGVVSPDGKDVLFLVREGYKLEGHHGPMVCTRKHQFSDIDAFGYFAAQFPAENYPRAEMYGDVSGIQFTSDFRNPMADRAEFVWPLTVECRAWLPPVQSKEDAHRALVHTFDPGTLRRDLRRLAVRGEVDEQWFEVLATISTMISDGIEERYDASGNVVYRASNGKVQGTEGFPEMLVLKFPVLQPHLVQCEMLEVAFLVEPSLSDGRLTIRLVLDNHHEVLGSYLHDVFHNSIGDSIDSKTAMGWGFPNWKEDVEPIKGPIRGPIRGSIRGSIDFTYTAPDPPVADVEAAPVGDSEPDTDPVIPTEPGETRNVL